MNENVTLSLIFLTVAGLLGWFAWLFFRHIIRNRSLKAHILLQNKLVDKLASSADVIEFANSETAKRLGSLAGESPLNPYQRILDTVKVGILSLSLGIACGSLHWFTPYPLCNELFLVLGILLGALGLGFLVCTLVAYVLSRSWGLLNKE